jgi:hypothetical protein
MVDFIFGIGEFMLTFGYLCTSVLWLRISVIIGLAGYTIGGFIAGFDTPGMRSIIAFSFIGILVNIYQSFRLIKRQSTASLPSNLREIYYRQFFSIPAFIFSSLYKLGATKNFRQTEKLAQQNMPIDEVMLITAGTVQIIKDNRPIITLGPGSFIGEMSFIKQYYATADVVALTDIECLAWNKLDIKMQEQAEEELYKYFLLMISIDLVNKFELNSHFAINR